MVAKKEVEPKKETKPELKVNSNDTYIMTVSHLSWGLNSKNHFYVGNKPLINEKVMGKFASTLKVWLSKGWIEKGSYKK